MTADRTRPTGAKRTVLVIGIGAGHPDHLTLQAVASLRRADVVFLPDKGAAKDDLARVRRALCARFLGDRPHRLVSFEVPPRDRDGDYGVAVDDWHRRLADRYGQLLRTELGDADVGAFLVWGDPTLYDSTLRILDRVRAGGLAFDCTVVPGISSVQALAAAHAIPLNAVGQPILTTTARRFAAGVPDGIDTVVVMLDDGNALGTVDGDVDVYWGAYVGTPDEILIAGKVRDVAAAIATARAEARAAHGWILDTYLLRRPAGGRWRSAA